MQRSNSVRAAAVVVVAALTGVVVGMPAASASSLDDVSPLSGPPGTTITVTAVCDLPDFGDEGISLLLNSDPSMFGGDIATSGVTPVDDPITGAVVATITVPGNVASGTSAFVYAFCVGASGTSTIPGPCVSSPTQCGEFVVTSLPGEPTTPDDVVAPNPATVPTPAAPSLVPDAVQATPRVTG